jgi:hypothetical protein
MPGKVYKTAMSTLSTSHTLIAVGTEDVQVRLCDITSGAFAHTLSGHRGMSCRCSHLSPRVAIFASPLFLLVQGYKIRHDSVRYKNLTRYFW